MVRNLRDVVSSSVCCILGVKRILLSVPGYAASKNFSVEGVPMLAERHWVSDVELNDVLEWVFLASFHLSLDLGCSDGYSSSDSLVEILDVWRNRLFSHYF